MAYTEFYMLSTGSNLNAGSTTGSATYNSGSGNWVNTTGVFTVTDGTNPSLSVNVGDFAAVYVNSATNTGYVGRVTAVQNAINGTITVPSTNSWGTKPANQTGTATITVGGAQLGPNGANKGFFSGNDLSVLVNTNGDPPRFNLKNDQTYTMTTTLSAPGQGVTIAGYTTNPGDDGRATISFGTTTGDLFTTSTNQITANLILTSSASSGTGRGFVCGTGNMLCRVTVKGARRDGFILTTNCLAIECEANANNTSANSGSAGFTMSNPGCGALRCIASGNTGSTTDGFSMSSTASNCFLFNNVSFGNGRHGYLLPGNTRIWNVAANNDAYGNGTEGYHFQGTTTASVFWLENNNALSNTGYGFKGDITTGSIQGWLYNSGFGAGTEANGNGTTNNLGNLKVSGSVTYASNVTPYVDTSTGDFSINLAAAEGAGRGAFTETQGGYSGTVGYPDIGAAQAQVTASTTYRKSSHVFCG